MTVRILLIDDNKNFLATAKRFLLTLSGTSVLGEAHDGHEALSMTQKLAPDLILLDIAMPALNGLNVARAMQFWPQSPQIILLSMHDNSAYRAAARHLGVLGFITKANFIAELIPIIDRLAATPAGQDPCFA